MKPKLINEPIKPSIKIYIHIEIIFRYFIVFVTALMTRKVEIIPMSKAGIIREEVVFPGYL